MYFKPVCLYFKSTMNHYNRNLYYLLDQQSISISQFENIILIPKIKILEPTPTELVKIAKYFNISLDRFLKQELRDLNHILEQDIKFLILDVDGTMTDGGMYFTENGDYIKKYNTKDGMAIRALTKSGFQVGIISHGHKTNLVKDRAELLGIQHVYVGKANKVDILNEWLNTLNLNINQVAFIGDDINDKVIMDAVGLSACPNDAIKSIRASADIVLEKNGGQGCVREFIDEYIQFTSH